MTSANANNDSIELLCHQCGQTFSAFLHEMADKNAQVVCPNCRANRDCDRPGGVKPAAGAR
jgi:DNA-directed RNA polymerase subunit RPC12/RpoP